MSLPITSFNCSMRWLLRLECYFCPTGPLGYYVRAAAQLLPCYCDSWPRWLLDFVCPPPTYSFCLCLFPYAHLRCLHVQTSQMCLYVEQGILG